MEYAWGSKKCVHTLLIREDKGKRLLVRLRYRKRYRKREDNIPS
jgi:hypothetical protein